MPTPEQPGTIARVNPEHPREVSATLRPREQEGQAPTIPENPTFSHFLCFSVDPAFRRLPEPKRQSGTQGFVAALKVKRPGVGIRTYLSLGLRHDTDFFLWATALDLAPFQGLAADCLKTGLGNHLKLAYAFLSMTRPSAYSPVHIPAFQAGDRSRRYLFLYPFVKSREWYLLPFEKRRQIMREHMAVGEQYPMVRLNTTYSFGLGDQDFVLAFETDEPAAFEDLVQRLRETRASRYTVRDTPFILGRFCPTPEELIQCLAL